MSKLDPILTKMRETCLSLPDTKETLTWGQPHFRVGDKIFSGYGEEKGKKVVGFIVPKKLLAKLAAATAAVPAPSKATARKAARPKSASVNRLSPDRRAQRRKTRARPK